MGSENQGRSDLTTVQRVVNFGAKKFAPVRMLSMNSDRDFSSQRTTNFIRNGSDAGDMASAAASMRGAGVLVVAGGNEEGHSHHRQPAHVGVHVDHSRVAFCSRQPHHRDTWGRLVECSFR